jgi:hypothetical protein
MLKKLLFQTLNILFQKVLLYLKNTVLNPKQCFGSALVICGAGYVSGSSILDECGSSTDPDSGKI